MTTATRTRTMKRDPIEMLTGDDEVTRKVFTISDAALGHITDMLSTFYQSGAYGCMREQISNGWDAALEAEVTPRIDVTISGRFEDTCQVIIRDNGCGMSPAHFDKYYCGYGESSKTVSENQTGMFGVGAKSWLALSDTATILTNTMEGEQTLAILSQDEDGRVVADIMPDRPTVDPSEHGTTVTIPLRDNRQVREVEEAVRRAGFAYPSNTVFVNGEAVGSLSQSVEAGEAIRHENLYFLSPLARREGSLNALNVLQGGILYPVEEAWLGEDDMSTSLLRRNWHYGWNRGAMIMELPHDSVLPTAQRDGLRDNRKNRRVASEFFVKSVAEMVVARQAEYDAQAWGDAIRSHVQFEDVFPYFAAGTFNWRGKTISNTLDLTGANVPVYRKRKGERASRAQMLPGDALEGLTVYRGFTADDLSARKFTYHYNAPIRDGNTGEHYFVLLPEGDTEGIEYEWLSVGKDDSPEYTEHTREEVYAATPRTPRSRASYGGYSPTLYNMYDFDAEGHCTTRHVSLRDVPSDVLYAPAFASKMPAIRDDKILKDCTVLGLRERQQVSTFTDRRPEAQVLDIDALYRDLVENDLKSEDMQTYLSERRGLSGHRIQRMKESLLKINAKLPRSSTFRKRAEEYLAVVEHNTDLARRYSQWVMRMNLLNLRVIREEFSAERETTSEWMVQNYPLLGSLIVNTTFEGDTLVGKHMIMYIKTVEAE